MCLDFAYILCSYYFKIGFWNCSDSYGFSFTYFSIFQKDNQLDNIIFVLHMNVNG
jgi:hypothetical protein